jgi:hypothetical protein
MVNTARGADAQSRAGRDVSAPASLRPLRSRLLSWLAYLAVFTVAGWITTEPSERVRTFAIYVPIAAVLYAGTQWFYARRDRRKRKEPQAPDYRLTRH